MATYSLTDLNGEEWTFDPASPLGLRYVKGIDGVEFDLDTAHGVDQRGVTVKGIDYKAGAISLGVNVHPARLGITGDDAVEILSTWRDGLGEGESVRGDNQMLFTVEDTGRFQLVRLAKVAGPADWEKMRYAGFFFDEIVLQYDESDWRTAPVDVTFTAAEFSSATVSSKGTTPSWPWFELTGPITNPTLGINGESVALPSLTAGQSLTIDTDPNWYSITDQTGADKTFTVTSMALTAGTDDRWRTQVPARTDDIPVTITGTGTTGATSLQVVVPQLFRSAL